MSKEIIKMMNDDADMGLYSDEHYAKQIRKHINILNELIKEAELRGLDISIWQYGKGAEHLIQCKIEKTIEL
jgi:hypothetical protein